MSEAIPSAAALLETIRIFLEKDIAPQVDPRSAYMLKVAANLLDTVGRELQQSGAANAAETAGLRSLLGVADAEAHSLAALNRLLCLRIASKEQDLGDGALWQHLLDSTRARLAMDNPRYKYSAG